MDFKIRKVSTCIDGRRLSALFHRYDSPKKRLERMWRYSSVDIYTTRQT